MATALLLLRRPPRPLLARAASSSSSAQWKQRQTRDRYARDARVQGLKSRAAFKLLEMDAKYRLFRPNQLVVDLGYAPGSWSQVAVDRTRPHGQVVGIDLIPAQPPRGVASFQGDFLSPAVRRLVTDFVVRHRRQRLEEDDGASYIDRERHLDGAAADDDASSSQLLVDLLLSDMLMNTSGHALRDHAGSMDLCSAALQFASHTLRPGGSFVCKFYQGADDKALELRLKKLFTRVHREKPDSSRSESKESYFVALKRRQGVTLDDESE
ncbi:hypothetical protein CDD83_9898 [Cordyceps sp. RAO-2017]|nr:hypothetical protein CDD83_9898 [Cordyceps sp. RAO-2017]